jgi:hypothetical protein
VFRKAPSPITSAPKRFAEEVLNRYFAHTKAVVKRGFEDKSATPAATEAVFGLFSGILKTPNGIAVA